MIVRCCLNIWTDADTHRQSSGCESMVSLYCRGATQCNWGVVQGARSFQQVLVVMLGENANFSFLFDFKGVGDFLLIIILIWMQQRRECLWKQCCLLILTSQCFVTSPTSNTHVSFFTVLFSCFLFPCHLIGPTPPPDSYPVLSFLFPPLPHLISSYFLCHLIPGSL